MPEAKTKFIGVKEAADLTGQTPNKIRQLCDEGEFAGAYRAEQGRGSSPWRIPETAVQSWLDKVRGISRDDIEGGSK